MIALRSAALIILFCAGCKQVPLPTLAPHKIDIQQGNVVTQDMVDKLRPGMTQSQVRFILGTPLVVDTFHKDRWDYVYRYEKGGTLVEHRRIIVVFENDKLARVEGDVVAAKPRGAAGTGPRTDGSAAAADKPASAKPEPPKSDPAPQPAQGANLTTQTGDPVTAPGAKADAATAGPGANEEKAKEGKSKEEKPREERGFFGRMLERLGF